MRNIKENILMALQAIKDNKLRYFLTLLGIVIGISSLVAIVSLGNGLGSKIQDQVMSQGEDASVQLYFQGSNMESTQKFNPYNDDVIYTIKQNKGVKEINKNFSGSTELEIDGKKSHIAVNYTKNNEKLNSNDIISGRNFNDKEFNDVYRVCVINEDLKNKLFKDKNAIGEIIQVANKPLRIIGVLKSPEDAMMSAMGISNYQIYAPKGAWNILFGDEATYSANIVIKEGYDMQTVAKEVTETLNKKGETDGEYVIPNMQGVSKQVGKITSIITSFIGGIASISLVVAGIGIMNVMYMAIIERTREIGIRRALGATGKTILFQFLIESLVVCMIGGILGLLLGMGLGVGVGMIIKISPVFSANVFIVGFGISIGMGIAFGVSPALKASKLNPIDALSYE